MSVEAMRKIGETFDVPLLANRLEGGRTPILKPVELEALVFRMLDPSLLSREGSAGMPGMSH